MLSPHTSVVSGQFGCKRPREARGPAATPGCSCSWGALALLPAPLPLQPPLPPLPLLLPSAGRQLGCAALGASLSLTATLKLPLGPCWRLPWCPCSPGRWLLPQVQWVARLSMALLTPSFKL